MVQVVNFIRSDKFGLICEHFQPDYPSNDITKENDTFDQKSHSRNAPSLPLMYFVFT